MGRALVRDPDVFLFDEPLSNLDAKLRIEMRTEIKKLHQRLGKTTIYVTHDQVEALTLASRIAVMDNGHIRQYAPPEAVYDQPDDIFVAGFMGSPSMNILRGKVIDNGGYCVQVSDSQGTIEFPVPRHLDKGVARYVGREVELGLRPETISGPGLQAPGPNLFGFERTVDVVEPTGPDTMFVFAMGGIEAIARVRPEDRATPGTRFSFEVDMAKAKLFDPTSGKRLAD